MMKKILRTWTVSLGTAGGVVCGWKQNQKCSKLWIQKTPKLNRGQKMWSENLNETGTKKRPNELRDMYPATHSEAQSRAWKTTRLWCKSIVDKTVTKKQWQNACRGKGSCHYSSNWLRTVAIFYAVDNWILHFPPPSFQSKKTEAFSRTQLRKQHCKVWWQVMIDWKNNHLGGWPLHSKG